MKRDRKTITALKREIHKLKTLLAEQEAQIGDEESEEDRLSRRERREERRKARREAKAMTEATEGLKEPKKKTEKKKATKAHTCPKCNANMDVIDLGPYTFKWCEDRRDCNYREKIK